MNKPKRAYELVLRIGGDTWEGVVHQLMFCANHVQEHGPTCRSVMGGPGDNHSIEIEHSPDMTHERYHAELLRYLDAAKAQREVR